MWDSSLLSNSNHKIKKTNLLNASCSHKKSKMPDLKKRTLKLENVEDCYKHLFILLEMVYFTGLLIYKKRKKDEEVINIDRHVNNTYIHLFTL